ncbi:MAG: hypothetical protein M3N29_07625 [Chloroflexota bacterium]|nr:hypothetical protein [Chloroflexota bacterium]
MLWRSRWLVAMPGATLAFHHGNLPSTDCAAEAAGSPSNDNGQAKEALLAHNPHGLPLPPAGEAGQSGKTPPGNARLALVDAPCANAD